MDLLIFTRLIRIRFRKISRLAPRRWFEDDSRNGEIYLLEEIVVSEEIVSFLYLESKIRLTLLFIIII